jgi:hypothetical protein
LLRLRTTRLRHRKDVILRIRSEIMARRTLISAALLVAALASMLEGAAGAVPGRRSAK